MTHSKRRVSGFSLIEITFTIGVAAVCLLAVAGLLSVGVQTNKKSTSQNVATNILAAAVSDLRAIPKVAFGQSPIGPSPLFGFQVNATSTLFFDTTGSKTDEAAAQIYRLTVKTGSSGNTAPMYAILRVTWPATIDPTAGRPDGSVETFAAIDLHK